MNCSTQKQLQLDKMFLWNLQYPQVSAPESWASMEGRIYGFDWWSGREVNPSRHQKMAVGLAM